MTSRLLALGLAAAGMVCIGGSAPTSALAQDAGGGTAPARPPLPPCFGTHHPAAFCPRCLPVPPAFKPTCGCPDAEHSLVCFLAHLIRKEREHLMGGSPKGPGAKQGKGEKKDDDEDKGDDEKKDDEKKDDKKDDDKGPPPPPPPPSPPPTGANGSPPSG